MSFALAKYKGRLCLWFKCFIFKLQSNWTLVLERQLSMVHWCFTTIIHGISSVTQTSQTCLLRRHVKRWDLLMARPSAVQRMENTTETSLWTSRWHVQGMRMVYLIVSRTPSVVNGQHMLQWSVRMKQTWKIITPGMEVGTCMLQSSVTHT